MTTRAVLATVVGFAMAGISTRGPAAPAVAKSPRPPDAKATPNARPVLSGVYPHLAVTNGGATESAIGAVMPWAGKLWHLTYAAHVFLGGDDKLYQVDAALEPTARPESVGGTHAGRMIHRESGQLILGPYFIDAQGRVRAIAPRVMPGASPPSRGTSRTRPTRSTSPRWSRDSTRSTYTAST